MKTGDQERAIGKNPRPLEGGQKKAGVICSTKREGGGQLGISRKRTLKNSDEKALRGTRKEQHEPWERCGLLEKEGV